MSIQAVGWVLEQTALPQGPKLVLVAIANHADHTTGHCFLRAETIALEASCRPRSVWRYVGALIRNGYLRRQTKRSPDGKQRANDYWMLFPPTPPEWDWGAKGPDDDQNGGDPGPDDGGNESGTGLGQQEPTSQELVQPYANLAHGETAEIPPNIPSESHGPCAIGVTRKSLEEPSESKPKDSKCEPPQFAAPPRSYRPPPPEPVAAQTDAEKGQRQFVIEGTEAWKAWLTHKRVHSMPTTSAVVNGKTRVGWYFPSLFPPKAPVETKRPTGEDAA